MGRFAAKEGDVVTATDIHVVLVPSPGGPVPTPMPFPFSGVVGDGLSANVRFEGRRAAMAGSTARNVPPHVPQEGTFAVPPDNRAVLLSGSVTVRVNNRPAIRDGDNALTCNDPVDVPVGIVHAAGTVRIGG